MTGLWTNDHDTLARALYLTAALGTSSLGIGDLVRAWDAPGEGGRDGWRKRADVLIGNDVVRVLDPDDTDLVGRVIDEIADELHLVDPNPERLARAVIEALRQP
jgi:hypothetical protein